MKEVNYGVIGTGYFGAELAKILSRLKGAKVVAIYDPVHTKELAVELGCDIEPDIESVCKRADVDAIIIASPNAYHKEPVLCAAKYNKHVFCEKPIALSYADCNEMIRVTQEKGLIFMAGHVMNFMDGVRKAKQWINDEKIGDVIYCHAERTGWEDVQETISWKKNRNISGGHLYHHIHELDFIQFIMGPASRVNMSGGNVAHQDERFGDEDDLLLITLEFPGKRFATMQYGSAFRWGEHYVKIQGTEGAILLDLKHAKVKLKIGNQEQQFLLHASIEEDEDRAKIYKEIDGGIMYGSPSHNVPLWLQTIMEREMKYFHDIICGAEIDEEFYPLLNGTAAKESIATADALSLSLSEDRKVSIEEIYSQE